MAQQAKHEHQDCVDAGKESTLLNLLLKLTFEDVTQSINGWTKHQYTKNKILMHSKTVNNLSIPTYRLQMKLKPNEVSIDNFYEFIAAGYNGNVDNSWKSVQDQDIIHCIDKDHQIEYIKQESIVGILYGSRDDCRMVTRRMLSQYKTSNGKIYKVAMKISYIGIICMEFGGLMPYFLQKKVLENIVPGFINATRDKFKIIPNELHRRSNKKIDHVPIFGSKSIDFEEKKNDEKEKQNDHYESGDNINQFIDEFIYRRAQQDKDVHNVGIIESIYGEYSHQSTGFIVGYSQLNNIAYVLTAADAVINCDNKYGEINNVSFRLTKNIEIKISKDKHEVIPADEISKYQAINWKIYPQYLGKKSEKYNIAIITLCDPKNELVNVKPIKLTKSTKNYKHYKNAKVFGFGGMWGEELFGVKGNIYCQDGKTIEYKNI
eukprot:93279_1